jgi:TfoX/Sxy family transcriptional regulator of competence genes
MAYDEQFAERIRDLLNARAAVSEKKMFGGLAFMINGNMAVGISSKGGLMVRVEPEETDALTEDLHVTVFGPTGHKPMKGFVIVDRDILDDEDTLALWVDRGADRASSMPPK